jgi:hypothetical protein
MSDRTRREDDAEIEDVPDIDDDPELVGEAPDALMIGLPVVTEDGDVLGTVGEDSADRFKVAAPMAADYWLPKSLIAGIAAGGDLVIDVEDDDDVERYKVPAPDAEPAG